MLRKAVENGDLVKVKLLIKKGAKVNVKDEVMVYIMMAI